MVMKRLVKRADAQISDLQAPDATTYVEYARRIIIDRNTLDIAVEEQPELFLRVCEFHVYATSRRDDLKMRSDQADADLAQALRRRMAASEERITDSMIKEHVATHPEHVKRVRELSDADALCDKWWILRSAFDQRSKMLRELVSLYSAGYYGAANAGKPRGPVRDALAEKAREELDARRHGPDGWTK